MISSDHETSSRTPLAQMPKHFDKSKSSPTWINKLVKQYAARPSCNETSDGVASIIAPAVGTKLLVSMEERFDKPKSSPTWIDELVEQYSARPSCNKTSIGVATVATNLSVSMKDDNKMTEFLP